MIVEIEEDCTVLLERALLHKTFCAFGEDGFGQYGRHDTPMFFDVVGLLIKIRVENSIMKGQVSICLKGYDADIVGHIQTDQNFDISLNAALISEGISTNALTWAPIEEQLDGCVTFELDVSELLGW